MQHPSMAVCMHSICLMSCCSWAYLMCTNPAPCHMVDPAQWIGGRNVASFVSVHKMPMMFSVRTDLMSVALAVQGHFRWNHI